MEEMKSVVVRNAHKVYGTGQSKNIVLNGLDMSVNSGSIYALIGASGCGKTTLLSCIIGMNTLDRGKIIVLGEKVKLNKTLNSCLRIGFMPQNNALQDEFTVNESLYFFGNLFQIKSDVLRSRAKMLTKLLKLPETDQKIADCSGGQQRRISLAIAMIHDPDLLILDEPTVGLDPILRDSTWNFMKNLTETSKISIILTTHYIEEATKAHQCGLMRNGILLDEDTPKMIMNNFHVSRLEEAFLCLCQTSEDFIESKIIHESREIEMNEICSNYNENQSDSFKSLRERKYFNLKTLKALIFKSYVQVVRRPILFVFLFLTISQSLMFNISFGGNPKGLKIGIVSDEILNLEYCQNSSSISLQSNDDVNFCRLNLISCRFIDEITEDIGDKIFYQNFEEAYQDAKSGKLFAVIYFSSNFTSSTQNLINEDVNDFILKNREIEVWMDKTNFQFTMFMEKKLNEAYQNYSISLLKACNFSEKFNLSPIQFMEPIYGESEINMKKNIGPVAFLSFHIFSMTFLIVSNLIDDRKKGSWNRIFLSGVGMFEYILAHSLVHLAIGAIQLTTSISLMIHYFPQAAEANLGLIVLLYTMLGTCGLLLGVLIGVCCEDHVSAAHIGKFIAMIVFYLSGFIWPFWGLPKLLQFIVKYFFFAYLPLQSFSDVINKNYGIYHESVYKGIGFLLIWCTLLTIISCKVLSLKKFARNS